MEFPEAAVWKCGEQEQASIESECHKDKEAGM